MEREALRQTLNRLHAELEGAGPIDASLRADLERALEEIRALVERTPPAEPEHPLRERLEELGLKIALEVRLVQTSSRSQLISPVDLSKWCREFKTCFHLLRGGEQEAMRHRARRT